MRAYVPVFLCLVLSGAVRAQFGLGAGLGGYVYHLWSPSSANTSAWSSFTSEQAFPIIASFGYSERLPSAANVFMEVSYLRKEFTAHMHDGGLGAGGGKNVDVDLDQLYLTIGPEFGKRRTTFRFGLQFGWMLSGTMAGNSEAWSSSPNYQSTTDTIIPTHDVPFRSEPRLLLALRHTWSLSSRWELALDPYASLSLGSMSTYGGVTHGFDLGARLWLTLASSGRGIWARLRSGPLRVRMKEGS